MEPIIITDVGLPVTLLRMGLLNYLSNQDSRFQITDMCYSYNPQNGNQSIREREFAKQLISKGILKVVSLSETQMGRVFELYEIYKPKFVSRSVSALFLAQETGYRLICENDLLREIASTELGVRANDKFWCVRNMVDEIRVQGITLDIELVNELL